MKKVCVVLLVLGVSGCGPFFHNYDNDYETSQNGPKLVVPPPLTCANISDFYDLPPQEEDPHVSIDPPQCPIHPEDTDDEAA